MDSFVKNGLMLGMLWVGLAATQAQVVDGVAAVVNDKVITFSQVRKEVDPIEAQYREILSGVELVEKVKEARLNSLKSLIERELIIQEFNSKGYFIPDNVIEDKVRKITDIQYEGDRRALVRTLQARGVSISNYKEQLRDQTIVGVMRQRNMASALLISPYQIEQYYQDNVRQFVRPDEVKLRVIYMKKPLFKEKRTGEDGKEEEYDPQKLVMDEILQKIRTGSDFASLAKGYSEGSQKSEGGLLGWVSESTLRPELAKVAFKLRPGQNSGVVETNDGYHIVMVEDLRKATVIPMAEVRERIESTLLQQEKERLQQEWLDGLRSKAFIKMFF
ncbi:MAG: parvulin peptidyl-prolyl isomerase [Blastochloris sp.]|nr:parvulin peptidyl-prolyl isomerase [Blastochloris sp.]